MSDHAKTILDWTAPAAVFGALVGYLPALAAALAVVWYCILIYDRVTKGHKGKD